MYLNHTECLWHHFASQKAWDYLGKDLMILTRWAWHNNYTHVASQQHDIIELDLQEYVTLCN